MDDFPVKNRKRAKRRAALQRMKLKAIRYAKTKGRYFWDVYEDAKPFIKKAEHLQSCDCWMCQNPRRVFKEKTLQEKKADEDFKQQSSLEEDKMDLQIGLSIDRYYHGKHLT